MDQSFHESLVQSLIYIPNVKLMDLPEFQISSISNNFFVILSFAILFFYLLNYYSTTLLTTKARALNKLPGGFILPFIGNSWIFIGQAYLTQERVCNYCKKYGNFARFWHLGNPQIIIGCPIITQKILSSNILIEKGLVYKNLHDFTEAGLVTSRGSRWRKDRKQLQPAFSSQLFDGFLTIFNKQSKKLVEMLEKRFKYDKNPKNIYPHIISASMDMVYEAALGFELNSQEEGENNVYAKAIHTLVSGSHIRMFKPYLYEIPLVYRLIGRVKAEKIAAGHIHAACLLARKRKEKELMDKCNVNGKIKTKPFLDILMESNPPPTEQEYSHHLLTIVAAGAETSASSIHNCLFFLALYPQYQRKCQEEVDSILDGDIKRELTISDLTEAKYLERCWKEAMRIRPSVPMMSRRITQELTLDNGYTIPKNVDVVFNIYDMHNDPKVFPNPKIFNPDRFLSEECVKRHPYSYIPFSMGIRNCIGLKYAQLEAKVTLIHVLSCFDVYTRQKQDDIKMIFGVPGEPFPNIELILELRK